MTNPNGPHILIIDDSIVEATMLMALLSPLTRNILVCSSYSQGFDILSNLRSINTPPDVIFLALPPSHHHEFDTCVKTFALALQNNNPANIIILGGDKLPPQFDITKIEDNSILHKPITREKVQAVMEPLGFTFAKMNCWEYMDCGRQPGGRHAEETGICPAAIDKAGEGIHCGKSGGRACWAISGTMCGGTVQGTFANKIQNCHHCDFYKLVRLEEGRIFESIDSVLHRLARKRTTEK